MTALIIAIVVVGIMVLLNYWCETAPTLDEAGYGYGAACFNCNKDNDDCNRCAIKEQYIKTGQWVS